jgi:hypothetical protein
LGIVISKIPSFIWALVTACPVQIVRRMDNLSILGLSSSRLCLENPHVTI